MDPVHIADIEKNNSEIIRIEISEFKDKKYVNIRTWYKNKEDGELKPSKKGIAVSVEKFPELRNAILKVTDFI